LFIESAVERLNNHVIYMILKLYIYIYIYIIKKIILFYLPKSLKEAPTEK